MFLLMPLTHTKKRNIGVITRKGYAQSLKSDKLFRDLISHMFVFCVSVRDSLFYESTNSLKNAFLGDGRNEFLEVERLEIRRILETLFGVKLLRRQQH